MRRRSWRKSMDMGHPRDAPWGMTSRSLRCCSHTASVSVGRRTCPAFLRCSQNESMSRSTREGRSMDAWQKGHVCRGGALGASSCAPGACPNSARSSSKAAHDSDGRARFGRISWAPGVMSRGQGLLGIHTSIQKGPPSFGCAGRLVALDHVVARTCRTLCDADAGCACARACRACSASSCDACAARRGAEPGRVAR